MTEWETQLRINLCLWNQSLISTEILVQWLFTQSPKSHPLSISPSLLLSLTVCVCASGRAVFVCADVHSVRVCLWGRVRWLTFVLLEAENHGACGFSARHNVLGCVLFDTVSNPASPLVRLQECCEHSGFSFSLCFLCVATEDLPSCLSLTDWLSDFHLSLCYAVLAKFLLSFPLSHQTVWCCLSVIHLLASPTSLPSSFCRGTVWAGGGAAVPASICVFMCLPLSLLCLPVYPPICPSGASRTMEMQSVPKTAWVFPPLQTNPSSPSLTDSPFTGWSIHRWLMDTNTNWHSQRSCQPVTTKTMIIW